MLVFSPETSMFLRLGAPFFKEHFFDKKSKNEGLGKKHACFFPRNMEWGEQSWGTFYKKKNGENKHVLRYNVVRDSRSGETFLKK
jgi:hypothetical protein